MFASRITDTVTLPSDPAVTVTIRKLSWLQRKDAQKQAQQQSVRDLREMGPEMIAHFAHADEKAPAPVAAPVAADPLATHDMLTVLVCGVKAWSDPEPVGKDTLSDLSPEDAEFLARAILRLSLPPETQETDRKNAE